MFRFDSISAVAITLLTVFSGVAQVQSTSSASGRSLSGLPTSTIATPAPTHPSPSPLGPSPPGPSPPGPSPSPPSPSTPANGIAYFSNLLSDNVVHCTITAGSITSCTVPAITGSWSMLGPVGIVVRKDVAYVANAASNDVAQCTITAGSITTCAVPTITGPWNMNGPNGIVLRNNIAYVSNVGSNVVTQCTIDGTGSITSCAVPTLTSGTWNLDAPSGLAISGNIAYLTNTGNGNNGNKVTLCTIDGTGSITSCTVPTLTSGTWNLDDPRGITIAKGIAYIVNSGDGPNANTVTQCTIDGTGAITSCAIPTLTSGNWNLDGPMSISIAGGVAFIPNNSLDSDVTQCNIDVAGTITSCAVPAISGSWGLQLPTGITVV